MIALYSQIRLNRTLNTHMAT